MLRARTHAEAAALLERIFPDASERARYQDALRRMAALRPVSARRLADRARLTHKRQEVAWALRADPRFMREPGRGPERYVLREEYRHAALLREEVS